MRHPTMLHSGDIDWKGIRVLVYSADDSFRFLVRQTFRKLNARDVLMTAGPQGLAALMAQEPHIALLEPGENLDQAHLFLRDLRAVDGDMPVLLMGASNDTATVSRLLPLGLHGVVPKRVSGHELVHRVGGTLKHPKRMPAAGIVAAKVPSPLDQPLPPPAKPSAVSAPPVAPLAPSAPSSPPAGVTAKIAPPPRPSSYTPPASEVAVRSGGLLDQDDIVTTPSRQSRDYDLVDSEDPLAKRLAERRRQVWLDELAREGRKPKKGKDVAALDVSAIVAAHTLWLQSNGAEGQRAVFHKMDLGGADLGGALLANASFREADLSDAFLAGSRLDGADFRYGILGAAQLGGAELGVAQLRHADLRLANLEGASLRGADLSGARLQGARLDGADFSGAVLVGCDLGGADLSKVENLTQTQVDKTLCSLETKLPPGLTRPVKAE